jgi:hypothetical protein
MLWCRLGPLFASVAVRSSVQTGMCVPREIVEEILTKSNKILLPSLGVRMKVKRVSRLVRQPRSSTLPQISEVAATGGVALGYDMGVRWFSKFRVHFHPSITSTRQSLSDLIL